jgi:predicted nucleic acid-binding protein
MLVIADASPLHYLILIASTAILPALFDRLVIPRAVAAELQHPQTPTAVRVWMATTPTWLDIQDLGKAPDASLSHLVGGEQEAITLAQALHTDLLLMDERAHAKLLDQGEGLLIVGLGLVSLRRLMPCGNLAEQTQGVRPMATFLASTGGRQRTCGVGVCLLHMACL